jgi:hypothetical protein
MRRLNSYGRADDAPARSSLLERIRPALRSTASEPIFRIVGAPTTRSRMELLSRRTVLACSLSMVAAASAEPSYRSVSLDSAGRLHIELENGGTIEPPLAPGQVSFGDPAVSPDRQTVGWLVLYPYPEEENREPIAGGLVLYRNRRVVHRFTTEQVFWDWHFQDGGKRVAYSTGPTHGGAAECVLRDVATGKVAARWAVKGGTEPPDWARTLRY